MPGIQLCAVHSDQTREHGLRPYAYALIMLLILLIFHRYNILAATLQEIDAAFPSRVVGLWLDSGTSGEWNYPASATYDFFSDYNPTLMKEFCDYSKGEGGDEDANNDAGSTAADASSIHTCMVPTILTRGGVDTSTPAPTPREFEARAVVGGFITADTTSGAAVVKYNRFLNSRVTTAIAALSAAAKEVSKNNIWVGAFSGELYNAANVEPFSGGMGLSATLKIPTLDGIGSPWLYFNASQDPSWGASLPQGPWDSPRLYGKIWIIEDDQRTSFGNFKNKNIFGYVH